MGKVVVVTSGKGGVGKTTSTAALGAAVAKTGKKVALVVNGRDSHPVAFDSTGFASFRVTSPPPDPNDNGAGALGVVGQVQLLGPSGSPLATLSVPPSLCGDHCAPRA